MKNKKLLLLITMIVLALLLLFGAVMMKLIKDNSECVVNPFVYGARIASKQGTPIVCSCTVLKEGYVSFFFDNESIGVKQEDQLLFEVPWYQGPGINISLS